MTRQSLNGIKAPAHTANCRNMSCHTPPFILISGPVDTALRHVLFVSSYVVHLIVCNKIILHHDLYIPAMPPV